MYKQNKIARWHHIDAFHPIKNQKSRIITRKSIFQSFAKRDGLGIVDGMQGFAGIDSWIGACFDL